MPITEYVVVEEGKAETFAPVVPDSPVAGDHEYVSPPLAVRLTELPPGLQMIADEGFIITVGKGFTITAIEVVHDKPQASETVQLKV